MASFVLTVAVLMLSHDRIAEAARPSDVEKDVLQASSSDVQTAMSGKLQKMRESLVQLQKYRDLEEDALEKFVEQVGSSARDGAAIVAAASNTKVNGTQGAGLQQGNDQGHNVMQGYRHNEQAAHNVSSKLATPASLIETKVKQAQPAQSLDPALTLPDAAALEKAIDGVEAPLEEATKQAGTSLASAVEWSQVPPLMEKHVDDMEQAVTEAKSYLVDEQSRVREDVRKSPQEVLAHEASLRKSLGAAATSDLQVSQCACKDGSSGTGVGDDCYKNGVSCLGV